MSECQLTFEQTLSDTVQAKKRLYRPLSVDATCLSTGQADTFF